MDNINTKEYWDFRFESGDWEEKRGREQTRLFAEEQVGLFGLPESFSGTITDFGCGLGDAVEIYRRHFPKANITGIDISSNAISKCREFYGSIACFDQGEAEDVNYSDVIIASNVFEHLTDDKRIASVLMNKCNTLFIVVPYNERIVPGTEHVNSYSRHSFDYLGHVTYQIYRSKGWGSRGLRLLYNVYFKNIFRPLFGKKFARVPKQIMYKVTNRHLKIIRQKT